MKPNEKTSSTTRNKQHNTAIVQTLLHLQRQIMQRQSDFGSVSPGSVSGSPRHKLQVSQSMGRQVHWYLVCAWGTKRMKTTRLDCEISLWKVWSCQQLMRIQQQTVAELDQWIKRRVTHNKAYGLVRPFAVVVSTGIRNAFAFGLRFERQMIPAAGWPMFVWRRRGCAIPTTDFVFDVPLVVTDTVHRRSRRGRICAINRQCKQQRQRD